MDMGQEIGIVPFHQYGTDFGLIDFMNEANFNQFIDLIRGENDQTEPIFNLTNQDYDCHEQNNVGVPCNIDGHFLPPAPPPVELFDHDIVTGHFADDNSNHPDFDLLNACQNHGDHEEEIIMAGDESSGSGTATTTTNATATTTATATNNNETKKSSDKADRSKTLISERRRRGRMKEKLYALRSLVPNITKMDKASIVGDAVSYVQDLQMQAKKLKAEIANLESSFTAGEMDQDKTALNANKTNPTSFYPITKKIYKVDVVQVEERGFYVKIVSNKGKGVAMLLYRALESLTSFNIQSSNLAACADNYVLTFTLHTMQGEMDVNAQNLKLWIATVFLNLGFEFQASQSA